MYVTCESMRRVQESLSVINICLFILLDLPASRNSAGILLGY